MTTTGTKAGMIYKRIGNDVYEPFATTKLGMYRRFKLLPENAYCVSCKAVVVPEGVLNAQGVHDRCQFCGERV